jgi:hypothetical protein
VARHIFQACPVWIYTQSNITQASIPNTFSNYSNDESFGNSNMAAIYSNGGNRWNILGFNFTKRDALYLVYIKADFHSVEKVARSTFCDHFLLKYKQSSATDEVDCTHLKRK